MQIIRRGAGEASLVQDGRDLLDLVVGNATEAEFDQIIDRLAALLAPSGAAPRVVLTYREGLLGAVQAEAPVELTVIEDDPHDTPPLRLVRRTVEADPAALAVMLDQAERRLARRPA
ncbi:hypothetical protein QMO56_19975 [Roseomonas sp. E05]|uniref:hypothetical protein n=1 Tax=Roseomonas sp. E05 TaxID=3046310 RepID=UPI0024BBE187|nr:hypothetical protein [Roseomonas sp. E05]MDJ0390396.1 hypothetical protein [Roseomonas sp. E05]